MVECYEEWEKQQPVYQLFLILILLENLKDEMKTNANALDNRKMKQLLKEIMDKDAAPDMYKHLFYKFLGQLMLLV